MRPKPTLEYRPTESDQEEPADTLWLPPWAYWTLVVATYLMIVIAGSILPAMLR